jgi:hypothetical protein
MTMLLSARAPSLFDAVADEPTLDDLLVGVWEVLTAHAVVECPLCGDELRPEYGAHARPVGGRCAGCGTVMS